MADNPNLSRVRNSYLRDGYVSGIKIIDAETAAGHRVALEDAEKSFGPLHYKTKVHTILQSPLELATLPRVLDIVEQFIGPDILLYNVTYIIKEPGTASHVSWHQDLTYWGLSHDDQVSVWLALSPASEESGCMRMVPGSHKQGRVDHQLTDDDTNVLFQGQSVLGVAEENAVMCPLQPGEASFHHGWTLHASMPNQSSDRRIGLNIQYLAPHIVQTKHDSDSAVLVRGKDPFGHFGTDIVATGNLEPEAVERQNALETHYKEIVATS